MQSMCRYVLLCSIVILPLFADAQFSTVTPEITLESRPNSPNPHSEVTIALNAYTLNTAGATISWYVDGIEETTAKNNRELTTTTGGVGDEYTVVARIALADGTIREARRTIRVTRADIHIEADTFVPPFYKGRSLPSVGSTVRAVVLPFDGSGKSPEQFSYEWRLNNTTLQGGSVSGRNYVEFEMPIGNRHILSVDVFNADGSAVMTKTIALQPATPSLYFYEDNPLKGLSRNTLPSPYIMVQDEITVHAEPFYVSRSLLQNNSLREWEIDGRKVDVGESDFSTIVLQRSGVGGVSEVGYHIRNLSNFLQGAQGSFRVQF